ncbi:MAG: hypothetical protein MHM6MM_003842 [Cercozoa sp. M6MM]
MFKNALKRVHELRFFLCQTAPASQGVREFLQSEFAAMRQTNPTLPLLVRESAGTEARIIARFGSNIPAVFQAWPTCSCSPACVEKGIESSVSVENKSAQEIKDTLMALVQ